MKNRQYLIFGISVLFLLLIINISTVNAASYERGWNVGTSIIYNIESIEREYREATNDTLDLMFEHKAKVLIRTNITNIIETNKTVRFEEKVVGYPTSTYTLDFSALNVSNQLVEDTFYFWFYWDYNFNRAILISFDMDIIDFSPFIEPDWDTFNNNFKTIIAGGRVIASIDTGYEIQHVFLIDFLNAVYFNINGKENINEARDSFTAETTRWTFKFDASPYILYPIYNYDEDLYEYFDYDTYNVTYELEYTQDGILSRLAKSKITSIKRDNVRINSEEYYAIEIAEEETETTLYSIFSAVIVLAIIPIFLFVKRKKKLKS